MQYKPEATDLVGTFDVVDDTIHISDPCYDLNTWCTGDVQNAKKGTWNAYVTHGKTDWGHRCWELLAVHTKYPKTLPMPEKTDIDVGVDSGQAGIFTKSAYNGGEASDDYGSGWYDACCELTLDSKLGGGVLDGGCVASTGFGDGSYDCFIARDGMAKAIGIKLVFISESDFDYAEDD